MKVLPTEDRMVQLGARVPRSLRNELQRAADEIGESEAVVVRLLLRRGLRQFGRSALIESR